jgi:hypothetical protein
MMPPVPQARDDRVGLLSDWISYFRPLRNAANSPGFFLLVLSSEQEGLIRKKGSLQML